MTTLSELRKTIDRLAPERLAESWDNVGLQLGNPQADVSGIITVLECDLATVEEAVAKKCNTIVAHHPLIFRPINNLRTDTYTGAIMGAILENKIGFIAAHTNLDKSPIGTNKVMADMLSLTDLQWLHPEAPTPLQKLVIFVPKGNEEAVMDAIDAAGGGKIGNYGKCSFRVEGTGTFQGDASTNPTIGEPGSYEKVEEVRLETIVPQSVSAQVVKAAIAAHPYEEVAYDLYPLELKGKVEWGLGYIGELNKSAEPWNGATPTMRQFSEFAREKFKTEFCLGIGAPDRPIKRVAVSSGAGGHCIRTLPGNNFDLLVTGEVSWHDAVMARYKKMNVLCLGHFASETFAAEALAKVLKDELPDLPIEAASSAQDAFWQV
jgi:dinuclear metal center YbgI/SA1388 family protein